MSTTKSGSGDTSWFVQDRFGLFMHWGIYSAAARDVWAKLNERIPDDEYERYFKHFDPDLYDPSLWAQAASDAGMKYFVVTTKHQDGFCLFDSKLTDYKSTNTPHGRDLLRPMAEAFRAQNMKVGFYHSLIDWHHPDFTVDDLHPRGNEPDRDKLNAPRDMQRYRDYLFGQVREILTDYGKVDVLWFDFSYAPGRKGRSDDWVGKSKEDWHSEELLAMVRELQPHIIVNDRLDLEEGWDFITPERFVPRGWVTVGGRRVPWESCTFMPGTWGYRQEDLSSWKSLEQCLFILIDVVSKGGNLLLNVAPTGRGEYDERTLDRLAGIGQWMAKHSRSIYGCTQAPDEFTAPRDCRLTYNPQTNRMYVHVFAWPFEQLQLAGGIGRVEYAQMLHDHSEVRLLEKPLHDLEMSLDDKAEDPLTLLLPIEKPNVSIPVVELFLKS